MVVYTLYIPRGEGACGIWALSLVGHRWVITLHRWCWNVCNFSTVEKFLYKRYSWFMGKLFLFFFYSEFLIGILFLIYHLFWTCSGVLFFIVISWRKFWNIYLFPFLFFFFWSLIVVGVLFYLKRYYKI